MVTSPAMPPYSSTTMAMCGGLALHLAQQLVDGLALRHEHRRAASRRSHPAGRSFSAWPECSRPGDVLEVQHAEQVVRRPSPTTGMREKPERRNRRMASSRAGALLDRHHVGARHHHLADEGVAELEDRVDHLALHRLDHLGLAGEVDQVAQLVLGRERAVPEAAARGHDVADQDEQAGDRAQQRGAGAQGRATTSPTSSGCWRPSVRGLTPTTTYEVGGHHDGGDEQHGPPALARTSRPRGRRRPRPRPRRHPQEDARR